MGYSKIPNEILELMASNLTLRETKILALITRKTLGFGKEWDSISLSQFEKGTGIRRTDINSTLALLVEKSLLAKKTGNAKTPNSWKLLNTSLNEYLVANSPLGEDLRLRKTLPTKERDTKEKPLGKPNKIDIFKILSEETVKDNQKFKRRFTK